MHSAATANTSSGCTWTTVRAAPPVRAATTSRSSSSPWSATASTTTPADRGTWSRRPWSTSAAAKWPASSSWTRPRWSPSIWSASFGWTRRCRAIASKCFSTRRAPPSWARWSTCAAALTWSLSWSSEAAQQRSLGVGCEKYIISFVPCCNVQYAFGDWGGGGWVHRRSCSVRVWH